MAKKAKTCEHISEITNYERLEFLGKKTKRIENKKKSFWYI